MGKKRVAFIGQRGLVGSILVESLKDDSVLQHMESYFLSTSQVGKPCRVSWAKNTTLLDATDIEQLREMDIIVTCQGSSYTKSIHPPLRKAGYKGYWIDAASALRMDEDSTIVLDPVNLSVITRALDEGKRDFIGSNCNVALMLMALGGLFKENLVEWMAATTYQAVSGAGAGGIRELLTQTKQLGTLVDEGDLGVLLEIDRKISHYLKSEKPTTDFFGIPLAGNLIAWIDAPLSCGQSREEWKSEHETRKILQHKNAIPIDGTCVRIPVMRCHSQALTIGLTRDISLASLREVLLASNRWVKIIPNEREATIEQLNPVSASGSLDILVGRMRKMSMGTRYLNVFTCGDQLLWGAAWPLLRMLKLLVQGKTCLS